MNSRHDHEHRFCISPLRRTRSGQSLLLVFLMLVAIVGVLALTLDFGFVILARKQMQSGVNSVAKEGLNNVDLDGDGNGDGRDSAKTLMRNIFDDNMDPAGNDTTVGAGLSDSLVQGNGFRQTTLGNGNGSRDLYLNRSQFIYRPNPELNLSNDAHGDMVFGDFDNSALLHQEFSDYTRSDFTANATGQSFLSRIRRTHNPNGLDTVPGVSSNGGGLPLLIGRLAWFSQRPANASYSIRRDGVTVRAAAIADSKFATRIWPAATSLQIYGAIPFGVTKADFIAQSNLAPFINPTSATLTHFGQPAEFAASGSYANEVGYIAIIDESFTPSRVVGFYLASPNVAPTRFPNASSRVSDAWDIYGELSATLRSQLIVSRQQTADQSTNELLKTPALVRSVR